MKLTPEQLEQCRKEFESKFIHDKLSLRKMPNGQYLHVDMQNKWYGFMLAWRPIPSVEKIDIIVQQHIRHDPMTDVWCIPSGEIANMNEAIRRAFGGQDE